MPSLGDLPAEPRASSGRRSAPSGEREPTGTSDRTAAATAVDPGEVAACLRNLGSRAAAARFSISHSRGGVEVDLATSVGAVESPTPPRASASIEAWLLSGRCAAAGETGAAVWVSVGNSGTVPSIFVVSVATPPKPSRTTTLTTRTDPSTFQPAAFFSSKSAEPL